MSIALTGRQALLLFFVALIALFVLSVVMLYTVAHIDVMHLLFSDGGGIVPNAIFPHG